MLFPSSSIPNVLSTKHCRVIPSNVAVFLPSRFLISQFILSGHCVPSSRQYCSHHVLHLRVYSQEHYTDRLFQYDSSFASARQTTIKPSASFTPTSRPAQRSHWAPTPHGCDDDTRLVCRFFYWSVFFSTNVRSQIGSRANE